MRPIAVYAGDGFVAFPAGGAGYAYLTRAIFYFLHQTASQLSGKEEAPRRSAAFLELHLQGNSRIREGRSDPLQVAGSGFVRG